MDRFDKELKNKLNAELKDIVLSEEAIVKIKEQLRRDKSFGFKDASANFLNYEIKIPCSACIAGIALAVLLGISSFTVTDKDIVSFMNRNIIKITDYWEEVR